MTDHGGPQNGGASPSAHDPTTAIPTTPPGAGGVPPAGFDQYGLVDDEPTGPPRWMAPALAALVIALVVALGVVLVTGDEAAAPTTSAAPPTDTAGEVAPVTEAPGVTESSVVTEVPITTDEPTGTDAPVVTDAATEPEPTQPPASDTTLEPAPDTTLAPSPPNSEFVAAPPGFVKIFEDELPILRACRSNPLPGFQILSYVYEDLGRRDVIEFASDEGSVFGRALGNTGEIIDLGNDGFGVEVFEGDSIVPITANPEGIPVDDGCPGISTSTDPTNPDFPTTHAIVEVCFGDVGRIDENGEFTVGIGFSGLIAEGGQFAALPNAGASFTLDYTGPALDFGAETSNAVDIGATNIVISADLVGNPNGVYAGQERNVVLEFDDATLSTCPTI